MIEYIKNHVCDIRKHTQNPMPLQNQTLDSVKKHKAFTGINLEEDMSRQDVINYFSEDLYKGFIATMLWGGKHRITPNYFKEIIDISKDEVSDKIKRIKGLLQKEDIMGAYVSMCEGGEPEEAKSNYIKNIGPAFFTKLFYFMSKAFVPDIKCMPLILDSHMQYVHCGLLLDEYQDNQPYYKWYTPRKSKEGIGLIHKDPNFRADAYMDYIKRMNSIACALECETDDMEAYLFDLRPGEKQSFIYKEIKTHFKGVEQKIGSSQIHTLSNVNSTDSNSIVPLYLINNRHEVFEEKIFLLDKMPILLIMGRAPGGSHFCGFWNRDTPSIGIDSIPEIQEIINRLSLHNLPWRIEATNSRKYIMYRAKNSYDQAQELMNKISKYLHNLNN